MATAQTQESLQRNDTSERFPYSRPVDYELVAEVAEDDVDRMRALPDLRGVTGTTAPYVVRNVARPGGIGRALSYKVRLIDDPEEPSPGLAQVHVFEPYEPGPHDPEVVVRNFSSVRYMPRNGWELCIWKEQYENGEAVQPGRALLRGAEAELPTDDTLLLIVTGIAESVEAAHVSPASQVPNAK